MKDCYTEINKTDAIQTIRNFLTKNIDNVILYNGIIMPIDTIIAVLEKMMNEDTFQFMETYWKQLYGIAMGTQKACSLTNIYIEVKERPIVKNTPKSSFITVILMTLSASGCQTSSPTYKININAGTILYTAWITLAH